MTFSITLWNPVVLIKSQYTHHVHVRRYSFFHKCHHYLLSISIRIPQLRHRTVWGYTVAYYQTQEVNQCWLDVGPASQTVGQHQTIICSKSRALFELILTHCWHGKRPPPPLHRGLFHMIMWGANRFNFLLKADVSFLFFKYMTCVPGKLFRCFFSYEQFVGLHSNVTSHNDISGSNRKKNKRVLKGKFKKN